MRGLQRIDRIEIDSPHRKSWRQRRVREGTRRPDKASKPPSGALPLPDDDAVASYPAYAFQIGLTLKFPVNRCLFALRLTIRFSREPHYQKS